MAESAHEIIKDCWKGGYEYGKKEMQAVVERLKEHLLKAGEQEIRLQAEIERLTNRTCLWVATTGWATKVTRTECGNLYKPTACNSQFCQSCGGKIVFKSEGE